MFLLANGLPLGRERQRVGSSGMLGFAINGLAVNTTANTLKLQNKNHLPQAVIEKFGLARE
jgi:hypothetical protein